MVANRSKVFVFQLITILFASACASGGGTTRGGEERVQDLDYRGSDCILIRTIRDYTPLDRQHLLIHGPGKRAYYVALLRPTFDMRGSIGIRVESRDDQLCPFGGDELVFGTLGGDRVPVRSISRLTAEQEEQLLIRYGKIDPAESETPADTDKVKGADVEELG